MRTRPVCIFAAATLLTAFVASAHAARTEPRSPSEREISDGREIGNGDGADPSVLNGATTVDDGSAEEWPEVFYDHGESDGAYPVLDQ